MRLPASVLALALAAFFAPPLFAQGSLAIVGGALQADNRAVFEAILDAMPADRTEIAVIPAASGNPGGSADYLAQLLAGHGVAPQRVTLVHVALVDDPETPGVDESRWASGGSDPAEIAKVERAGLIWFTGGDQARIMATLIGADGVETPLLTSIRARLAAGAVIGGTSAGAAIMGTHMIACGNAETALVAPVSQDIADCNREFEEPEDAPLVLTRGLGFLPAVVDQHFSQRGRLGRLVRALACFDDRSLSGYGIDENTALIVAPDGSMRVAGPGSVTIVDRSGAEAACDGAKRFDGRLRRYPQGELPTPS